MTDLHSDASAGSRSAQLDRAIRALLAQAPELEAAAVVSFDGLPMAAADPSLGVRSLAFPAEAVAAHALAEIRRLSAPRAVGRTIRYPMAWADGHEG